MLERMATKTKQKKILKGVVKEKMILFGVRFHAKELEEAKALADEHAGGNLAAYIRAALKSWRPGPDDLA